MKTITAVCIAIVGLTAAHAQEAAGLEDIIRRRDALLTQILEETQRAYKVGTVSVEQMRDASVALWSFRRDTAKAEPERLKWQREIVAFEKQRFQDTKKRVEAGVMTSGTLLRAEEQMLAAEQKLLEMQVAK